MRAVTYARVAATLLLGVTFSAHAQNPNQAQARDSAKVVLIHQLLTETHAVDLAMTAMETAIPAQRAANPRIPGVFWDRFLAEVHNRRGEFEDMIVTVYANHYSSDEIRQLIAFYQTPIGQKMVTESPAVVQESMEAGRQWGGRIGASIGARLQSEGTPITP